MCFESLAWATKQELPAMQKIVLIMLANHENAETKLCFPSIETLAEECGMSERSVSNQIARLSAAGLIEITRFNHTSNRYTLLKTDAPFALADAPRSEADAPLASKPVINQEIKLKEIITTTPAQEISENRDLTAEEQECFDWAMVHDFWFASTVSTIRFLKVYNRDVEGGLKQQFDAHKKAQQATKQTGLNSEIFFNQKTGEHYASNSKSNQSFGLSNTEQGFADRQRQREEWIARTRIIDGYATRQ